MKKYFNRFKNITKRKLRKPVSKHDIQGYQIILGHINNPNSISYYDPKFQEYIIRNKKTHYDLIITPLKVLLVNSKAIVNLEVGEDVRTRAIQRVVEIMSESIQNDKNTILDRKYDILEKILSNVKK